jgi:hypothetical protein
MQLLADALDLAYRLPVTMGRVRALAVAPWKARRLAQATHQLGLAAAAHVDAQLADRVDSCGAVAIDRAVAQAAATCEPERHAEAEKTPKASWDVRLTHRTDGGWAGTSHLEACGDTVDLSKLYDVVCDHAAHLARLGDTDHLGARKAKALGIIADAQAQLDLSFAAFATEHGSATVGPPVRRPSLTKARLYLHVSAADLERNGDSCGVGEVERLGPATLARLKHWLGATRATIVPVLDLGRDHAVDVHDPPETMRETVVLRDRHCVFPWCRVDARACDLDHIEPYVPLDDGGPPGQTSPTKLACLCRRHHNAKTSRRWRYRRTPDGTYLWHGPYGATYLVTPRGTTRVPRA